MHPTAERGGLEHPAPRGALPVLPQSGQHGDTGGAVPSPPTRRLLPSPWLALPVTAVTLLPSSQLPLCGD